MFFNRVPIESLMICNSNECISVKNSSPPSLAQSSIVFNLNLLNLLCNFSCPYAFFNHCRVHKQAQSSFRCNVVVVLF